MNGPGLRAAVPDPRVLTRICMLLGCLVLLGGCARNELVVLLEDADGGTGRLDVRHADQQTTLDRPLAAARVSVLSDLQPVAVTAAQVRERFQDALAAQPAPESRFLLYFQTGSTELQSRSRTALQALFDEVGRRPAPEVLVTGHTDRVGEIETNDRLSLARAERVAQLLIGRGLQGDIVSVAGRGEREPRVPTADGVAQADNRRVEVTVR
ncbi:MAG: OmpA family protein [Gammaproteobacteria bacterium]|nr:OmpA family protein [Gammaproteobacteria bacterium]